MRQLAPCVLIFVLSTVCFGQKPTEIAGSVWLCRDRRILSKNFYRPEDEEYNGVYRYEFHPDHTFSLFEPDNHQLLTTSKDRWQQDGEGVQWTDAWEPPGTDRLTLSGSTMTGEFVLNNGARVSMSCSLQKAGGQIGQGSKGTENDQSPTDHAHHKIDIADPFSSVKASKGSTPSAASGLADPFASQKSSSSSGSKQGSNGIKMSGSDKSPACKLKEGDWCGACGNPGPPWDPAHKCHMLRGDNRLICSTGDRNSNGKLLPCSIK